MVNVLLARSLYTLPLAIFLLISVTATAAGDTAKRKLRVGIVQNSPIVYVDHEGTPKGIFVEVLDEIARQEGWELDYIHDVWASAVKRVINGDLDLMTTIGYTKERSLVMDFCKESLVTIWGQVYVQNGSNITNIQDLSGKRVAVLKNGINGLNFRELMKNFGMSSEIIEKESYDQVVEMVAEGKAVAGVTNNITGYILEQEYDIQRSPIMFSPLKLGFSTPKGQNEDIRETVDAYLTRWKQDKNSFYYKALDRNYGAALTTKAPRWIARALTLGAGLIALSLIFIVALRLQVKKQTSLLRASEEKYRMLFENSPLAVLHLDAKGLVLNCNENLIRMMGSSREKIVSFDTFKQMQDSKLKAAVRLALNGKVGRYQGNFKPVATKKTISVNGYFGPLFSKDRKITGAVGIFEDVTELIQAEQDRRRLEEQLRQTQKLEAVGSLAGGIAHDFNNILSAILGYSELASDEFPIESPQRKYLEEVLKAGKRAKDLVAQILAFSRRGDSQSQPVKVQSIIKEVMNLLRSSIPATIEIRAKLDEDAGAVFADPTQIHQVIMNLCTNAYHAMREKGGVLDLELKQVHLGKDESNGDIAVAPGTYLNLNISDTGAGISQKDLSRIFDPYFTTKPKGEGTGLGLSIVHSIIKSCGGDIVVYSKLGKGTSFSIFLPMIVATYPASEEQHSSQLERGTEHILVVDDEESIAKVHEAMLTRLGYTVTSVSSSSRALELFAERPDDFDLLVTDMDMPEMTGITLAEKCLEILPQFPIIICTGFSELINAEKARKLGIADYLMKPVLQEGLAQSVRRVLDKA